MTAIGIGIGVPFGGGLVLHPKAEALIKAIVNSGGTLTPAEISATNNFFISIEKENLLQKMIAVYLFIGGTATSHKFNAINPLDTNAAFRLLFNGGWTHDSNGITGNGVNAFAECYISGANLTNNSTSVFFYSRTNLTNDTVDIGGANGTGRGAYFFTKRTSGNGGCLSNLYENQFGFAGIASSAAFFSFSRTSNVLGKIYINGSPVATSTTPNTFDIANLTTNIVIGAYRANAGGTPILHSARNLAAVGFSTGLNDTENTNLYNIIQAFETTLNRQI